MLSLFLTLSRKLLIEILFSQRSPVTVLIIGKSKHILNKGFDLEEMRKEKKNCKISIPRPTLFEISNFQKIQAENYAIMWYFRCANYNLRVERGIYLILQRSCQSQYQSGPDLWWESRCGYHPVLPWLPSAGFARSL